MAAMRPLLGSRILSDVHGNLPAFEAVLADIDRAGVDARWCLGDLVGYGAQPDECVALAAQSCDLCLIGNHDLVVIDRLDIDEFSMNAAIAAAWTKEHIGPEALDLPRAARARRRVARDRPLPREPARSRSGSTCSRRCSPRHAWTRWRPRVGAVGHSHVALYFARPKSGTPAGDQARGGTVLDLSAGDWIINPGGVGQPRDGDPRAAWLLLDLDVVDGHLAPRRLPGRAAPRGRSSRPVFRRRSPTASSTANEGTPSDSARPVDRSSLVAGCGSSKPGPQIPASQAANLISRLQEAERRANPAANACLDLLHNTVPALQQQLTQLPQNLDSNVRTTLTDGINRLQQLAQQQCSSQQQQTTTNTTPTTTPSTTETTPSTAQTQTPPSTSTQTETAPHTTTTTTTSTSHSGRDERRGSDPATATARATATAMATAAGTVTEVRIEHADRDRRALPARAPPRRRRDVDRLPRAGLGARASGRNQAAGRAPRGGRGLRRALPPRGARRRPPPAPEHRPGLRLRRGPELRAPLHRDGIRRRALVRRPAARRGPARHRGDRSVSSAAPATGSTTHIAPVSSTAT